MIEYIYFVKCPNCEDEHFYFFKDAEAHALGCLDKKPIITQVEVNRNDFGECTDSCDLGTIWSWEDQCRVTEAEPAKSVFTRDDLKQYYNPACDPEFSKLDNSVDFDIEDDSISTIGDAIDFLVKDEEEAIAGYEKVKDATKDFDVENKQEILDTLDHIKAEEEEHIEELEALLNQDKLEIKKPIPADMTIESLVEAMEENEDFVECKECYNLAEKAKCTKTSIGYVCEACGGTLKEDMSDKPNIDLDKFLDEEVTLEYDNIEIECSGPKRDADDWDEWTETHTVTYSVDKGSIIHELAVIVSEEDLTDYNGDIEDLRYWPDENDLMYFAERFDFFFEKYEEQLKSKFKFIVEELAQHYYTMHGYTPTKI